jgi:hypothetical protein
MSGSRKKCKKPSLSSAFFQRTGPAREKYVLAKMIRENQPEDNLSLQKAKVFYRNLKKAR